MSMSILRERFTALCRIGTPSLGRIVSVDDKAVTVYSEWSQRSPEMKKAITNSQVTVVDAALANVIASHRSLVGLNGSDFIIRSQSSSSDLEPVVLSLVQIGNDKFDVVRREGPNPLFINLTKKKAHGKIHRFGDFGGVFLSPTGRYLLYTAEKNSRATEFIDADEDSKNVGDKFLWREHFGEALSDVIDPVICVLELETGNVQVIDCLPKHLFPVQKTFTPDETAIIISALETPGYKSAKCFTSNRNFTIGRVLLSADDPSFTPIATGVRGVEMLRHTPAGALVIFGRRTRSQAHQGAYGLFEVLNNGQVRDTGSGDHFLPALADRSFTTNGSVVFGVLSQATYVIVAFDFKSKQVKRLSPPEVSDTLLDVKDNLLLVARSSPTQAPQLVIGKINSGGKCISWLPLSDSSFFVPHYKVNHIGDYSFLLLPDESRVSKQAPYPLVVQVHGGPHAAAVNGFPKRSTQLLLALGIAVLQMNYPGSLGYTEEYALELGGHVGIKEITFIEDLIEDTLAQFKDLLSSDRIGLLGSSFAGMVVTQLAGKHPNRFKVVAAHNPVLNIRTMYDVSDAPEWCTYEVGNVNDDDDDVPLTRELQLEMLERSAVTWAPFIKAPFLLAVGGKDLCVPSHFRPLIRALRSNNVEYKVLYYPDSNHFLGEVDVEIDLALNTVLWIEKYLV